MYDLLITREKYPLIKYSPGIYVFLSDDMIPLYVGKSVSLKSRVRSHLSAFGKNTIDHVSKFYFIGIIYCDESLLNEKETEAINFLKPELNKAKVNYPKIIDMSEIKDIGKFVPARCKYNKSTFELCKSRASSNGFCYVHDPNHFSWICKGKYITSEMQRLLYECQYKKRQTIFLYE